MTPETQRRRPIYGMTLDTVARTASAKRSNVAPLA